MKGIERLFGTWKPFAIFEHIDPLKTPSEDGFEGEYRVRTLFRETTRVRILDFGEELEPSEPAQTAEPEGKP